jgi:hypothetical protein
MYLLAISFADIAVHILVDHVHSVTILEEQYYIMVRYSIFFIRSKLTCYYVRQLHATKDEWCHSEDNTINLRTEPTTEVQQMKMSNDFASSESSLSFRGRKT